MATSYTYKPIVTDGLVLYLDSLNSKSYDGAGTSWYDLNSQDGVSIDMLNGVSFVNGIMSFDGVDDYCVMNISAIDKIPYGTESISVSVWFLPKRGYIAGEEVFGIGSNSYVGSRLGLYLYDYLYIESAGSAIYDNNPFDYSQRWINVCFTIPSTSNISDTDIYIDGILITNTSIINDVSVNMEQSEITIGCIPNNYGALFMGDVSVIQMYNKTLTPNEVLQNYNALKNRFI